MTRYFFPFLFIIAPFLSYALPAQVFIIRHAEKPATGPELSIEGQERAAALVPYFLGTPELNKKGPIQVIFAQKPKDHEDSSVRPIQTITPLAKALNLTPIVQYTKNEHNALVKDIITNPAYNGKILLLCFEHKALVEIAKELGAKNVPDWPGHVFDWVWILNFENENVTFDIIPQKLMYGDAKHV